MGHPSLTRDNGGIVRLQRTMTDRSLHAQTSLRRMATHEGGEHVVEDHEDPRLDPPVEEVEEGRDTHEEDRIGMESADAQGENEDEADGGEGEKKKSKKKAKKEVVLQDQTNLLPVKQVMLVFVGLSMATFCSLLDQTIVTTALPTLGRTFGRADISSWVGTAYLLTSTALQPIYGRLSDIFGRKFVLLGSLVIFFIGSLACSVAQTMIQLIVFRAIQGVGGGGILTLAMIIVSDVVTLRERGKYQGVMGCVVATANSVGPIVGALFSEKVTWRWCFYINLPITAMSVTLIVFLLPLRRVRGSVKSKLKKLDWYGSVLTISWAVLVLLGLSWGGSQYSWSSAAVLAPLIIGLALLVAFLFVEAKAVALPLVPMHIFKIPTVASGMFTTFLSGQVFYACLYYLPQYFQVVRRTSPIRSGVLILPLVTVQTCTAFACGIITSQTGDYWWNLTVGFTMWTIGIGLLSTFDVDTSLGRIVGFQMIVGVGAGQTFQTSLIAIQACVDRREMATATGIRNALRMLGGTISLTVCSTIINNIVRRRLGSSSITPSALSSILKDPSQISELGLSEAELNLALKAYAHGIRACFWYMIPCAGISLILTIFFVQRTSLKREDDEAKKAEAKAWIESKKEKRRAAKGHHHSSQREDHDRSSEEHHTETEHEDEEVEGEVGRAERNKGEPGGSGVSETERGESEQTLVEREEPEKGDEMGIVARTERQLEGAAEELAEGGGLQPGRSDGIVRARRG